MRTEHVYTHNRLLTLLVLVSSIFYVVFGYFLERSNHSLLLFLFGGLVLMYLHVSLTAKPSFKTLTTIAIFFRVLFLFTIPNLSQDFYRFIWDGRIILEGINPYLYTPTSFIENAVYPIEQGRELYEGMGSLNAGHYSNYPPINQLCFVIAGLFSGTSILGSVIILRLIIIAADIGIIYFGRRLLKEFNLDERNIFIFILNPLVIIELTGNLHFEGVMIFFLFWSLYLLKKGHWKSSAIVLSISISTKLIPLMFLPLYWQWFTQCNWSSGKRQISLSYRSILKKASTYSIQGYKNLCVFYTLVLSSTIILFLPFMSKDFILNYTETVALWFQNFEFNASLYYIAREIGYGFRGYNEIAIIGKWIAYIVIVSTLIIAYFRNIKNTQHLIASMLIVLAIYLFTATTVHPWYLATLLALSTMTKIKFPMVWSAVVILSYLAYRTNGFEETLTPLLIEYLVVIAAIIWDIWNSFRQSGYASKIS